MDAAAGFGFMFTLASVVVAGLGLRARLRRSHGLERQQFKWLAFAGAVTGVLVVAQLVAYLAAGIDVGGSATLGLGFAVFPVAAGSAILRYRLYDIDVVINRALVYGALTVALGTAYLGTVCCFSWPCSRLRATRNSRSRIDARGGGAFRPARARIQEAVDHRFFRRRYDSARTLERFSAHIRREVELSGVRRAPLRGGRHDAARPRVALAARRPVMRIQAVAANGLGFARSR